MLRHVERPAAMRALLPSAVHFVKWTIKTQESLVRANRIASEGASATCRTTSDQYQSALPWPGAVRRTGLNLVATARSKAGSLPNHTSVKTDVRFPPPADFANVRFGRPGSMSQGALTVCGIGAKVAYPLQPPDAKRSSSRQTTAADRRQLSAPLSRASG